jgi:hypothetical protein
VQLLLTFWADTPVRELKRKNCCFLVYGDIRDADNPIVDALFEPETLELKILEEATK